MRTYRCQHLDDTTYVTGILIQTGTHKLYLCDQCYGRLTNEDLAELHSDPSAKLSVGRMVWVNMSTLLES